MNRAEMSFKLPAANMKVLLLLFALVAMTCAYVVLHPIPCPTRMPRCRGTISPVCENDTGRWVCEYLPIQKC
ncbi:hypothetical protein GE061_019719 [Apolygus lucorum]|uniref:Uncharacterized protein n=1 Tax=Apolygus lucorum TaxID=248454 RepID=A0A8S9XBV9_APOLU|nr:hypothetical protein GE061_019719 [Apolygus lucorum]